MSAIITQNAFCRHYYHFYLIRYFNEHKLGSSTNDIKFLHVFWLSFNAFELSVINSRKTFPLRKLRCNALNNQCN